MNINDILSDDEIEECIDGSSNITLIRSIIELTQDNNTVNEESFADIFAFEIRGFMMLNLNPKYGMNATIIIGNGVVVLQKISII